jgi:hypothetical protein
MESHVVFIEIGKQESNIEGGLAVSGKDPRFWRYEAGTG